MADSFLMPAPNEDASVKSRIGTGRRPNQSMSINPNNFGALGASNLGQTNTPRGARGRAKSVVEPEVGVGLGLVSNFQQQLQQTKVMDQEQDQQVLIGLN